MIVGSNRWEVNKHETHEASDGEPGGDGLGGGGRRGDRDRGDVWLLHGRVIDSRQDEHTHPGAPSGSRAWHARRARRQELSEHVDADAARPASREPAGWGTDPPNQATPEPEPAAGQLDCAGVRMITGITRSVFFS